MIKAFSDGPTRVLKLASIKNKSFLSINWERESSAASSHEHQPTAASASSGKRPKSLEVYVNLSGGIGVSLVQWLRQEYEDTPISKHSRSTSIKMRSSKSSCSASSPSRCAISS